MTLANMKCHISGNRFQRGLLFILIFFLGVVSTVVFIRNTDIVERLKAYKDDSTIRVHWWKSDKSPEINNNSVHEGATKPRILCWVMTQPKNHKTAAKSVKATWGKRCNTLLFMSSTNDTSLPTVILPVGEGRNNLWAKTKEAFKYVHKYYMDKADWFMKADDDTYVIVENLRYMLTPYNTSIPLYFGCHFKPYVKQGYMSGGAGYILSKEALRRFVEDALPDKDKCRQDGGGAEDVEIGKCLENVNVTAMETRDNHGINRFSPFSPGYQFTAPDPNFWYQRYIYNKPKTGPDCCSNISVTFHYVSPEWMYTMDYFIYKLKVIGTDN